MKPNTHNCVVSLILEQDGKILMLKRPRQKGGNYSLVGGKVDANESVTHAIIRESFEEAGLILKHENLRMVHVMHREKNAESFIHFFFFANQWQGTIVNKEPDKCDGLEWFGLHELPINSASAILMAVVLYQQGVFYSEFNWKYPENAWAVGSNIRGLK